MSMASPSKLLVEFAIGVEAVVLGIGDQQRIGCADAAVEVMRRGRDPAVVWRSTL